jgi:hypothetical protein
MDGLLCKLLDSVRALWDLLYVDYLAEARGWEQDTCRIVWSPTSFVW